MHRQRKEAAALLKRFVEGDVEEWEFDDFVSSSSDDLVLETFRLEVARIPVLYPPQLSTHYTSEEGASRILEISQALAVSGENSK